MAENNPRRMEEIRKYSAIYGRFDCKRNPQKPLTLHEVRKLNIKVNIKDSLCFFSQRKNKRHKKLVITNYTESPN